MLASALYIKEIILFEPIVFRDERGEFFEVFSQCLFDRAVALADAIRAGGSTCLENEFGEPVVADVDAPTIVGESEVSESSNTRRAGTCVYRKPYPGLSNDRIG
jgi:hypothetical protein